MTQLGKNWNGHIYGTNTGNVAVALEGDDSAISGLIRFNDSLLGISVFDATGHFSGGNLTLVGKPQGELPSDVTLGQLTINGALTSEGRIDGEWLSTIGSGGTFQLWPHSYQNKDRNPLLIPEQLNTSFRTLGAIRLYGDDVRTLIAQLLKDFSDKRAVVTYVERGIEKSIFSGEFDGILDKLSELRYLKISVQEQEMYGLNRNAMIEFSATGENTIRVQSVQEAWARGKAEVISDHVQRYQPIIATQFRKFGLTVNLVIAVTAFAALPGLQGFYQRLLFASSIVGIQGIIAFLHSRYVPNFILFPAARRSSRLGTLAPVILSWGFTVCGAILAAIVYGFLKGELHNSPLFKFIHASLQ